MKQIYVANCIEAGERFTSTFKSSETNKQKLYDMGRELANEWGGECISVTKWKPQKYAKLWDMKDNKWVEGNAKKIENFIAKHPNSTRYDYSKTEYFEEKPEDDIWDFDLSNEENLASYKAK